MLVSHITDNLDERREANLRLLLGSFDPEERRASVDVDERVYLEVLLLIDEALAELVDLFDI